MLLRQLLRGSSVLDLVAVLAFPLRWSWSKKDFKFSGWMQQHHRWRVTITPFSGNLGAEYSALPRFKDNKTICVADEDAPEDYRGQQPIFPRR
jgi:hypothetical protein